MPTADSDHVSERRFSYPTRPWGLPLFCDLLFVGLFLALYCGTAPGHSPWYAAAAYLFCVGILRWVGPVLPWNIGLLLSKNGITVNRCFTRWEDIVRIDPGPLIFRYALVRLRVKRRKKKFWIIEWPLGRPFLKLPPYPIVFKEVIPAIQVMRPEIEVSPGIERMLRYPDNAGGAKACLAVPSLVLLGGALTVPFWTFPQSASYYAPILPIVPLLVMMLGIVSVPAPTTARDRFVQFSLYCPLLVGWGLQLDFFSTAERYAVETVIGTAVAACAISVALFLTTNRLSRPRQFAIAALLAGTAFGIYHHRKAGTWPAVDVPPALCEDPLPTLVWGRDGTYLASLWAEKNTCLLHLPDMTRVPLPRTQGHATVVWLNEGMLIRQVRPEQGPMRLLAYRFSTGRETQIPTADEFGVSFLRPVSPDGRLLAWVDKEDKGDEEAHEERAQTLNIWNLETMSRGYDPRTLPERAPWSHGGASWVGERELVVWAQERTACTEDPKPHPLRLLRIDLANERTERFSSTHAFLYWRPTLDFRFAFGDNGRNQEAPWIHVVNLETHEVTKLPGEGFPLAPPFSERAFRVTAHNGRRTLMELHLPSGKERPLHEVPEGMGLAGVSPDGQLALLHADGSLFLSFLMMHIPSGAQHRLYGKVGMSSGLDPESITAIPATTPFAPDGKRFALATLPLFGPRTRVYTVPPDWPDE